jgi:hypothetical protein
MHVSMTQGVVSVDISLTKEEAQHLYVVLNYTNRLWKDPQGAVEQRIEATAQALFNQLYDAGFRSGEDMRWLAKP